MRGGARTVGAALDALFPPACVSCGRSVPPGSPPVCELCRSRLPAMAAPRCPRCGATAAGDGAEAPCGECRDWPRAAPRCRTPFRMEGVAAILVRALKYSGWTGLAPAMAGEMAPSARELCPAPRALVPVPLAPARRRERGFNQAGLLAGALGNLIGAPVAELLERPSGGRSQARLGRSARRGNVQGAFVATERPGPGSPGAAGDGAAGGETVLLVDDVITTGATVAACGAALDRAGHRCAGAVAFARTLPPLHGA